MHKICYICTKYKKYVICLGKMIKKNFENGIFSDNFLEDIVCEKQDIV